MFQGRVIGYLSPDCAYGESSIYDDDTNESL